MSLRADVRRGKRAAAKGLPPVNGRKMLVEAGSGKVVLVGNRCERRQRMGFAGRRQW